MYQRSWIYRYDTNYLAPRLRIYGIVLSRGGFEETTCYIPELEPGLFSFTANPKQKMVLAWKKHPKAIGRVVEEGRVRDMAEPFLDVVAEVVGVDKEVMWARWRECQSRTRTTLNVHSFSHHTERYERDGAEDFDLVYRSAAFRMNDKGGLHARTAVLLQKALVGREFVYVQAIHEKNGRVARMACGENTKPAYWLLLLRLEARRNEVVTFKVAAKSPEEAENTLEAIEGILGRPKPWRFEYWREIGFERWCQTYFDEGFTEEARFLGKHYELFFKAQSDPGPHPPPGTPMGTRV